MSNIHLIGGEKGGVGKSLVARLLAQYMIDHSIPFLGFDSDHSHGALLRFYAGYASPVLIDQYDSLDVIVEAATDNKNRTAAEIRCIFTKNHGNLASSGSVSYMFHKKGQITVARSSVEEDKLLELTLEAGAEELTTEEDQYVITTSHDQLYAVAETLKEAGVPTVGQKFTFIPDTTVSIADESVAKQVLQLCDALEDDDDVQNVYSNIEIPDEVLAKLPA